MGKHSPPYTPMCNRLLRYFLANPQRTEFQDELAEKQFQAVKEVYESLSPYWQEQIGNILPYSGRADLTDAYIHAHLIESGATTEQMDKFYGTLRYVNLQIAIALGYVSERKGRR